MNSSSQAQKGLKTFTFTLVISLVVFSAIYFIINSGSSTNNKNEVQSTKTDGLENAVGASNADEAVTDTSTLGAFDEKVATTEKVVSTEKTAFTDLANQKVVTTTRGVLAGSDTSPSTTTTTTTVTTTGTTTPSTTITTTKQSTVPETGVSGPTIGLILSTIILGAGAFILFLGPRKMALSSFEKKVIKGLH